MRNILLIARYDEIGKRMAVVGEAPSVMDTVVTPGPTSYHPFDEETRKFWRFNFPVDREEICKAEAERVEASLKSKATGDIHYSLDYRGKFAIPKESLERFNTIRELQDLIESTMLKEATGEINPDSLTVLDYRAEVARLRAQEAEKKKRV